MAMPSDRGKPTPQLARLVRLRLRLRVRVRVRAKVRAPARARARVSRLETLDVVSLLEL